MQADFLPSIFLFIEHNPCWWMEMRNVYPSQAVMCPPLLAATLLAHYQHHEALLVFSI